MRILAAHDNKPARRVLEQVQQASPYPSVRTADLILQLLGALGRPDSVAKQARSSLAATLESMPTEHPSDQDRQKAASLLEKAIEDPRYNLKRIRMEMRVAEGTFNRLCAARAVKPRTWRKALLFLEKFDSDNAK